MKLSYSIKIMVTVFFVTIIFSCKNDLKEVSNTGLKNKAPLAIIENGIGHYTDSGDLKSYLETTKMVDYSNRDFSFFEFPEGMSMFLYDENNNKSNIISDYAIVYNKTGIIDLRGNVIFISHKNDSLKTNQLFYDQNREWVFTNEFVTLESADGPSQGYGFGSDKDFKNPIVFELSGKFNVKE